MLEWLPLRQAQSDNFDNLRVTISTVPNVNYISPEVAFLNTANEEILIIIIFFTGKPTNGALHETEGLAYTKSPSILTASFNNFTIAASSISSTDLNIL